MTINLPDDPALLSNVGSALRWRNEFCLAAECLNRSLSLNLASGEAWNNRGQLHEDLGEWPEAMTAYQNAYSLIPTNPVVALSLAYQRMRAGEWSNEPWLPAGAPEGTREFPSTWALWESGRMNYGTLPGIPIWQGEDLTGDRLLITPEGGFGDYIWLSRYLPKLAEMVGPRGLIWLVIPDSLLRMAQRRFPFKWTQPAFPIEFLPASRLSGFHTDERCIVEYQIPLLSLLTRFLRDPRNIPPVALNSADKGIPPALASRFNHGAANGLKTGFTGSPDSRLRVGLCATASEVGVQRPHRSVPALALAPLAEVPGVEWISLMPDRYSSWAHPMTWVRNAGCAEWEWEDTARVIEQLSLVVSVDTACLHLACSLGIPTIGLIPKRSDWKWAFPGTFMHPDGYETSIWYPNLRIIRQRDPISWDSAIQEVVALLSSTLRQESVLASQVE